MQNITKNLGQFIFRTSVFFEFIVTKNHMILMIGGKSLSYLTIFSDLMWKRGLKSMFAGVHVSYSRSFLSWEIIYYFYEVIYVRLGRLDYY